MRVLHVSGPSTGGIGIHMKQLQKGLAPWGVQAALAPPARVRPGSVLSISRQLKEGDYDLVHCHGYQGSAVGRAAAALAGVPAIVTIHNTIQVGGITGNGAKFAENWMRKHTAYWVAVSVFLRNYAWNVLGVPDDRTEVIANGVEVPDELPPWYQRPVVGIVARLVPSKGVDVFLRAIQLVRPEVPEMRAVVVGDGPARAELVALRRSLGLEQVVRFLGHRDDVPDLLRKMAVFVLPTRSEGLGISVMEAMVQGVPVVATAVGGVPELVEHNRTGLLVNLDDHPAVAGSIRAILRDKELAERLRQAAFERIANNYSTEAMLERTLHLYRRVLHE